MFWYRTVKNCRLEGARERERPREIIGLRYYSDILMRVPFKAQYPYHSLFTILLYVLPPTSVWQPCLKLDISIISSVQYFPLLSNGLHVVIKPPRVRYQYYYYPITDHPCRLDIPHPGPTDISRIWSTEAQYHLDILLLLGLRKHYRK